MLKDFVKLLLLSIISIIVFVLLYKFLCGEEIIPKKENRYYFIVDDSSGIRYNTKLYLNGYKIGKITKIEFDYDTMKTKINIAIDRRIKLKKGSCITITSDFLGNKSLILTIGSGEDLDNNSYVEYKNISFSFNQLTKYLQEITTKIKDFQNINFEELKNKIINIFSDKDGGSDFVRNINDIFKNINLLMEEVKNANVKDTVANINNVFKSFKEDVLPWIKELKEKNKGKGLMSFSF